MKKFALFLLLPVLAYAAYPYWSLYRLGEALEVGDEVALERHVDWAAVRDGLKDDLSGMLSRQTGEAISDGDGEAAIGGLLLSALGQAMLAPLVDAVVTPEGLAAMIREGRARQRAAAEASESRAARTSGDRSGLWDRLAFAFFTGPATFEAVFGTDEGEDVVAVMALDGMRWQLVRLRLPES